MVTQFIQQKLLEKSKHHRAALTRLEIGAHSEPMSKKVNVVKQSPQIRVMNTIVQNIDTSSEDFIFYFDRLTALLIEQYVMHPFSTFDTKLTTLTEPLTKSHSSLQQLQPPKAAPTPASAPKAKSQLFSFSAAAQPSKQAYTASFPTARPAAF
jgi:hypothetical protein